MSLILPEVTRFSRKPMSLCPHSYEGESCIGRLQPTFRRHGTVPQEVTIEHLACSHCGALFWTELAGKDLETHIKSLASIDAQPFGDLTATCSLHSNALVGTYRYLPRFYQNNGRVFDRETIIHFCVNCLSILAMSHTDHERLPQRRMNYREA